MTDPQHEPTPLRQEHDAQQETDAEYRERFDKHMPREYHCSVCGAMLTDDHCPCCAGFDESEE